MPDRQPFQVLIAGGGPAALEAALRLHRRAGDAVQTTLLAPEHDYVTRPMIVLEPFAAGHAERRPLAELAALAGAAVHEGSLASVDPARHEVTTEAGETLSYDALLVAVGARGLEPAPHVLAFGGRAAAESLHGAIQDLELGYLRSMAFVVPAAVSWTLPIYELALMTAQRAWETGQRPELTVVTPERAPLEMFGPEASRLLTDALREAGVVLRTAVHADFAAPGELVLHPGGEHVSAERIVTLPELTGPDIPGLPLDADGFIRIDRHGRVEALEDVWAAGDATSFPIKQGGIACQQADAAAEAIAATAGAGNDPAPFEPVLRGVLITERASRFMRRDVSGAAGDDAKVMASAMWWPPTKIAGEELSRVLEDVGARRQSGGGGTPVEVDLPVHAL
jgi:sulfide:quinone oxidoreductase